MTSITKKPWRDAATLIIAGKRVATDLSAFVKSTFPVRKEREFNNNDRSISNLSVTTRKPCFDILMLKRSSKSSFMPDAFVFPGGVIDISDSSPEWLTLFESAGYDGQQWKAIGKILGPRPKLFLDYKHMSTGPDIAFRICALRETFEESGVLLVKGKNGTKVADLSPIENLSWRRKVHKNASMFLLMCQEMNFVPDIWSLREWSNWLTPAASSKRYNTVFYLCCLDDQPSIQHDNKETTHAQWSYPLGTLQDHVTEKLWIAPPQVYELIRLLGYHKMEHLDKFAKDRQLKGCENILPVRHACNDGIVGVLPGDDMYPNDPEHVDMDTSMHQKIPFEIRTDETIKEFRSMAKNLNRIEMISRNHYRIINTSYMFGHPPICFELNEDTFVNNKL